MKRKPGPSKRDYFHTTITLPRSLLAQVRAMSIAKQIPHTQIYREAVEAYIKGVTTDVSNGQGSP